MELPALQARTFDLSRIAQGASNVRAQNTLTRMREAEIQAIPEEAKAKVIEARRRMSAEERERDKMAMEEMARSIAYIENLPEVARPAAYSQELGRLQAKGIDVTGIPQTYSPEVLARGKATAMELGKLFEEADRFVDIDPATAGLPKGFVAQRGPKNELKVVYKPGGDKDGASIMERLRWMYAFGEDPEQPGKKLDDEARAMAGKALAPGSVADPEEFERGIYETLRRGFSSHEDALEDARKAREAFFGKGKAVPANQGASTPSQPFSTGAPTSKAVVKPLPPDKPIKAMDEAEIQDLVESKGDGLSTEELLEIRDRLKALRGE